MPDSFQKNPRGGVRFLKFAVPLLARDMSEAEKAAEKTDAPGAEAGALEKGAGVAEGAELDAAGAPGPGSEVKEAVAASDKDSEAAPVEAEPAPPPTATAKTAESVEDVVDVVKAAIDLAGYVPAKFERHHQTMVRE